MSFTKQAGRLLAGLATLSLSAAALAGHTHRPDVHRSGRVATRRGVGGEGGQGRRHLWIASRSRWVDQRYSCARRRH